MNNNINLRSYRPSSATSYSGRPQGEDVRKKLKLDIEDALAEPIQVIIPNDTSSFNPSFFLGLFFKSISKLGVDRFSRKYDIIFETNNDELKKILSKDIQDGLRNAKNTLDNKDALSVFS